MLNLQGMTAAAIRARAEQLDQEAQTFDEQRCHGLARLKRRDAACYRRALQAKAVPAAA